MRGRVIVKTLLQLPFESQREQWWDAFSQHISIFLKSELEAIYSYPSRLPIRCQCGVYFSSRLSHADSRNPVCFVESCEDRLHLVLTKYKILSRFYCCPLVHFMDRWMELTIDTTDSWKLKQLIAVKWMVLTSTLSIECSPSSVLGLKGMLAPRAPNIAVDYDQSKAMMIGIISQVSVFSASNKLINAQSHPVIQ